jgi:hypothetical protein
MELCESDDDFLLRAHSEPALTEYSSQFRSVSPLLSPLAVVDKKPKNDTFMKLTLSSGQVYSGPNLHIQIINKKTEIKKTKKTQKKEKQKRLFWTREEDELLLQLRKNGTMNKHPTKTAKQCRERWSNHLCPGVNLSKFSREEDELICKLYAEHGSSWSKIATYMNGRRDNAIKNRWNSSLKKFMLKV